MINTIRFYELYLAAVTHWRGGTYDFFKYGGKMRSANESSFAKRRDKVWLEKWARQSPNEDFAIQLLFSNLFMADSSIWPGQLNKTDLNTVDKFWSSIVYNFDDLYEKYFPTGVKSDQYDSIQNPSKEYIMFFWLINELTNGMLTNTMEKRYNDDIFWQGFKVSLKKIAGFLKAYYGVNQNDLVKLRRRVLDIEQTKRICAG